MLADVGYQRLGQPPRSADAHLRFMLPGQQRRNTMTEAGEPQVNFAQPVEEQQTGTDGIVLELALDELDR